MAVTGSHNPPDYNGFKIVVGGETLSGDAITDLYPRIREDRLHAAARRAPCSDATLSPTTSSASPTTCSWTAVQGGGRRRQRRGRRARPAAAGGIGAEVIPLYCDVDGTFPNHHPDPSDPDNLEDLIQTVKRFDADLGLAFDGDGDRLGVVTKEGEIIYPDRLLMLFAADVLERNPARW